MMSFEIRQGDCLELLRQMPDESVQCCVTSPPYFGLRDYGVEGQIGLEQTPAEYVGKLVEVFREVRRVLTADGIAWVNLGDSYAGSGKGPSSSLTPICEQIGSRPSRIGSVHGESGHTSGVTPPEGYKAKDLMGIPWRVAFALQDDGWYLRQDIIWSKPNPMPESVTDRCTKAHEYIFLLSKSAKYYFDQDAIKTPLQDTSIERFNSGEVLFGGVNRCPDTRLQSGNKWKMPDGWDTGPGGHGSFHRNGREKGRPASWKGSDFDTGKTAIHQQERMQKGRDRSNENRNGEGQSALDRKGYEHRGTGDKTLGGHSGNFDAEGNLIGGGFANKRSVWSVPTQSFKEAHFATFPPKLIEPMILAGSREGDTVLDPFNGAATTGLVSLRYRRNYIGLELNPEYIKISEKRLREVQVNLF